MSGNAATDSGPRVQSPPAGMPDYVPRDHSMQSITEQISDIVLTRETGKGWYALFAMSNLTLLMFGIGGRVCVVDGGGRLGHQHSRGLGIHDYRLRLVDRHRPRGHVDFGDPAAAAPKVANLDQSHRRSHDDLRPDVRGHVSAAAPGTALVLLLAAAISQHDAVVAAVPQRAGVGCFRGQHLLSGVVAVLVHGHDSGPGHAPRSGHDTARRRSIYGMLALGWRNSARHWQRFEATYLLLGGLATPLVVSVHSVVSSDFAMSIEPGWHETVFPPYFVAGAIFSGFAMVLLLCIPLRHIYRLKDLITTEHLAVMAKIILVTSLLTSYGYLSEQFLSWFGQETSGTFRVYEPADRVEYAPLAWTVFFCNTIVPQLFWIPAARRSEFWLVVVSLAVLLGMWLERYVIIITTLHRDYLPSSWGMFRPTIFDYLTFFGSIGLFLTAFLLFTRLLPVISMSEMRALLPGSHGSEEGR